MRPCRYVEGYGYYRPSHMPGCRAHECGGCEECLTDHNGNPVKHCTARRSCSGHLDPAHPLTCPRCVGRTRGDLAVIVQLSTLMLDEAVEQGIDSEAAYLAGPACDPEAWSWRKVATKRAGLPVLEDDDPHHPYSVLGRWDFMLREDYDQPTGEKVTVTRSAAYLDGLLTRIAQDDEQDWPLFASEIADCRGHLETVLHDSRAPEKGRPCPVCSTEDEPGPSLVKRYADHDTTGATDTWRCAWDAAHVWSEADYRMKVATDYLDNADRLTATQMHDAYDVRPGSLRGWASKGLIRKRGRDHTGLTLYDVADTLAVLEKQSA